MEVVAHLFRHAEEDAKDRETASSRTQGRLTRKGVEQVIDTALMLRKKVPDAPGVEVHFQSSAKLRARGTAMAPYYQMRARYRNANLRSPEINDELDLPRGNRKKAEKLIRELGREKYLKLWAAGKGQKDIESIKSFNARIARSTLGWAIRESRRRSEGQKHLVFVTHDGGTEVASGFGAVFTKLTGLDPQEVVDRKAKYGGPMRNGEYMGIKVRDGKPVSVEFRGRTFTPTRGRTWQEAPR